MDSSVFGTAGKDKGEEVMHEIDHKIIKDYVGNKAPMSTKDLDALRLRFQKEKPQRERRGIFILFSEFLRDLANGKD